MIKYETNSKLVQKGQIFVAIKGHTVDGHDYIEEAIKNGASKVVGEKSLTLSVPYEQVPNSEEYLKVALKYLKEKIIHVSISIECKLPKINPKVEEMRRNIARILNINKNCVGITATSGEGLTEFGKGNGINVLVCITVE